MSCEHKNLAVVPSPTDGTYENVRCLDCNLERRRISVAETTRAQIAADSAAIAARIEELGKRVEALELIKQPQPISPQPISAARPRMVTPPPVVEAVEAMEGVTQP